MSEELVLKTLQKSLTTAVGDSIAPTIPIKFLLRTFIIPDDQKYFEIVNIPNSLTDETWGEDITYRGVTRIILHWPNDDSGAYEPMRVLESVASYFRKSNTLLVEGFQLKIRKVAKVQGPLENGKASMFAFTIEYNNFNPVI